MGCEERRVDWVEYPARGIRGGGGAESGRGESGGDGSRGKSNVLLLIRLRVGPSGFFGDTGGVARAPSSDVDGLPYDESLLSECP